MFAGIRTYRGPSRFLKHFTGWIAFDGADYGEELNCAKVLDSLPEVKHWVRNAPRHPNASWLPTPRVSSIRTSWLNSPTGASS